MTNPRTGELSAAGVSIWLDDLSRQRIESGNLAQMISEFDIVGVTTNPTIFAAALAQGEAYAADVQTLVRAGASVEEVVFELTTHDVATAATLFTERFIASKGYDGRVSIEVSPTLAHDAQATVAEAKRLWAKLGVQNAMIKIPATRAGLSAITEVIAAGISVNVTLIFSLDRYRDVINAYLDGLEAALANNVDIAGIHSVASFFVSRLDAEIDARLHRIDSETARTLKSRAGLANARLAYETFQSSFAVPRAQALRDKGANLQRPLWASTGVKDPSLPDTLYVSGLVAEGVVNTMPEKTLRAYADHGQVPEADLTAHYGESRAVLDGLAGLGIDLDEVTDLLERQGVEKFVASWDELLTSVRTAMEMAQ